MPFFSIIIPVYNVAPYLRECLDSVLAQAFTDWEAICVDDGSTDGSGTILDEYVAKDTRFRVIHQPNAGVSAARNKALDTVQGEWIAFLDADDLLREDFLARLLDAAKKSNADLAIGGVLRFGCDRKDVFVGPCASGMFPPEELYVEYNSLCAWSCGKIYKRRLWDNIRFPVGIAYSEDRYVLHKILYDYSKVPFVAEALYRYRSRGDSAFGSKWKPQIAEQQHLAYEEQMYFFHDKGLERAERFTLEQYFLLVGDDILKLRQMIPVDVKLIEQLQDKYREKVRDRWDWFVQATKRDIIQHSRSCGEIKIFIDRVLSDQGKVHLLKRVCEVLKYDGVGAICRKLFHKITRLQESKE